MAYVSLYRKYRPQTFSEIVGQDHVTRSLINALTDDRLHHAYLFTGPRGTGKTSTARILAKSVNCVDGPTPTPCNQCVHCVAITEGTSVDVIELDMASHGGVDDARELRDRARFSPASARRKVYILDEVHMASNAAFNALLKLIEEPPSHVLFTMATTDPQKVLGTIMSRVQRLDLRRVGAAAVAGRVTDLVQREGATIDQDAVDAVVRAGDGSLRDTESVLEQVLSYARDGQVTGSDVEEVLGQTPFESTASLVDAMAAADLAAAFQVIQDLLDRGTDLRNFATDLVRHVRDLLVLVVAPTRGDLVDATQDRTEALQAQAAGLSRPFLTLVLGELAAALDAMRKGEGARLAVELAVAQVVTQGMPAATGSGAPRVTPAPASSSVGDAQAAAATPDPVDVAEVTADGADGDLADADRADADLADAELADAELADAELADDDAPLDQPATGGSVSDEAAPRSAVDVPSDEPASDELPSGEPAVGVAPDDVADRDGDGDTTGVPAVNSTADVPVDESDGDASADGAVGQPTLDGASDDGGHDGAVIDSADTAPEVDGDEPGAPALTDLATRATARAAQVAQDGMPTPSTTRPDGPAVAREVPPEPDEVAQLERIQSRWSAVLELVRADSVRGEAMLARARPTRLRRRVLCLTYPASHSFHAGKVASQEFDDVLVPAIERTCDVRVRIDVEVDGQPIGGGGPKPDEPTTSSSAADVPAARAAAMAGGGRDEHPDGAGDGADGASTAATTSRQEGSTAASDAVERSPMADLDPAEAMDRAAAALVSRLGATEVDATDG